MTLATTSLANIELEHPLMNAAGTCKTVQHAVRFARSAVSAMVVGPITPKKRDINPGNVYWSGEFYSLNSLGMPNPGEEEFFSVHWPRIRDLAQEAGKPVILQIAGFNAMDYVLMAKTAEKAGVKHVELNFGCPNIWVDGQQHRIVSFDTEAIAFTFKKVREVFSGTIGIKLSPYSDPWLLEEVAETIISLGTVGYVACSNTFPNALELDPMTGNPVITFGNGLAGMSGKAMKPIALGQVVQFAKKLMGTGIDIVGVGGITNMRDVTDFLLYGATAVQSSTPFWNSSENPSVYSDILSRS